MKLLLLMLPFLIIGCGSDDEAATGEEAPSAVSIDSNGDSWNTYRVASFDELPDCEESTEGRLYYVSDDSSFRACDGDSWSTISIQGEDGTDGVAGADGENGSDGASISTNKLIDNETTDYCPGTQTTCIFNGGHYLNMSDGTLLISVGHTYSSGGDTDTDTDRSSPSAFYPPEALAGYLLITPTFWDGSTFISLWLYFSRASISSDPTFKLYSDTDDDGVLETDSDALEVTLTTSVW